MILSYYKEPNFGDAVNPMIFNHLLPGFFDKDESSLFLGIGSILGFIKGNEKTRRLIVFTSGHAYGKVPQIDKRYDIRCVRGPLTAKALNISPALAITDGAVLLNLLPEFQKPQEKKFRFSYIPHHRSEEIFDQLKEVLGETGVNYISPKQDPDKVIRQIRESECVLAEAMHGAIIADAFRVPWIPVRMFKHINAFKWKDWAMSMETQYQPETITSLFSEAWIKRILDQKLNFDNTGILSRAFTPLYKKYQDYRREKMFVRDIRRIMEKEPFLSSEELVKSRTDQLMGVLEGIKRDYKREAV